MNFGKILGDFKDKAEKFLEKPETKEALGKIKEEFTEAKVKVGNFIEESDKILKEKVDSVLNKNNEDSHSSSEVVETEAKEVVDTEVTVETPNEEVIESEKEEVVETEVKEVVDAEVTVETPNEEVIESEKEEVLETKVVEEVQEALITDLGLADKVVKLLNEEGYVRKNQLEEATDEELLAVKGIGKAAVTKIREALK